MKKNILLSLIAFFVLALAMNACKSDAKQTEGTPTGSDEKVMTDPATKGQMDSEIPDDMANPDQAPGQLAITDEMRNEGFRKLLNGQWRNLADQTEVIEFRGSQLIYYKNGNEVKNTTFDIDFTCANSPCKDIEKREPGWCMVEDGVCKTVTRLDMLYFIVQPADGSAGKTQYEKVRN